MQGQVSTQNDNVNYAVRNFVSDILTATCEENR